jgi:hypothetical protein
MYVCVSARHGWLRAVYVYVYIYIYTYIYIYITKHVYVLHTHKHIWYTLNELYMHIYTHMYIVHTKMHACMVDFYHFMSHARHHVQFGIHMCESHVYICKK